MSDEGEKTCPLCAEEMDLTDQQLKPCRCGYEVCVWCWNHIMEMAEKDETEGRCPACRTPYDKEKIVGTASKCERLAAEISMEKKKSQKSKAKTSEGRKQLSSVRVIQRNLVYIVGLPLELADEDLLLHKEYFGQYGKVLKVSISRTSAGTIQQFANNTCSVYITYSKEDEAVRCIESIHGFTLDGRSLRACFGTTKYCHAWLRSVPCTNADCLYLHEIGSHEDSFSKDEFISAYSRVQQITGLANSGQRRSGNVLPPPADDYCNNSSTPGKPVVKSTPINLGSSARVSPPTSSAGRTGALPAAASWGSRGSNFQTSTGGIVCSNGPVKQKPDIASASLASSAPVAAVTQTCAQSTVLGKKVALSDDIHPKEPKNKIKPPETKEVTKDLNSNSSEDCYTSIVAHAAPMATGRQPSVPVPVDINKKSLVEEQSNVLESVNNEKVLATGEKNQKLCPDVTSVSVDKQFSSQNSAVARPNGLSLDCFLVPREQGFQISSDAKLPYMAPAANKAPTSLDGASLLRSDLQSPALPTPSEKEDDFEMQRLSDAIVTQTSLPSSSHSFNLFHHSRGPLHQHSDGVGAARHNVNPVVHRQDEGHLAAIASNGLVHNQLQSTSGNGHSYVLHNGIHETHMGNSDYGVSNFDSNSGVDGMESSIISNILSLDLDAWDDSLTSPQDLVKLLGESERHQGTFNTSNSWKAQHNNQSRFSFARQEESRANSFVVEPSYNSGINSHSLSHREPFMDRLGNGYGLPQHHAEQYDSFGSNQSVLSTNKLSVTRAQISAPPGFSVPSRLPPPGFSSHGRTDQTFEMKSGNHYLERASSFRDPYKASPSVNSGSIADIEFIDPAILAVGKGRPPSSLGNSNIDMGPTFSTQTSAFESDSRLQLLMQRSLQPQQNFIYADIGENYSPSDAYGFSSRHMEPSQISSRHMEPSQISSRHMDPSQISGLSSFSQFAHQPRNGLSNNSHWDSWPEVMSGNNMGTAELLRNDRLNFNKLYGSYEEPKFQMPGSGDLYNRTFGM